MMDLPTIIDSDTLGGWVFAVDVTKGETLLSTQGLYRSLFCEVTLHFVFMLPLKGGNWLPCGNLFVRIVPIYLGGEPIGNC